MRGNKWIKLIILLILFILIFLVIYETLKQKDNFKLMSNNSIVNDIYYCDNDLYTLYGNTCIKYNITNSMILGDVDSSGEVDISDIDLIKQYIDKKEFTPIQIKAADVNNDSQVDMDDVSLLQNYILEHNGDIGTKLVCDDDYELVDNICQKKIIEEAKKLNYISGDINLNNKLDKEDLDLFEKYLNDNLSFSDLQLKIADMNKDDLVNIDDYNILKKKKLTSENKKKINLQYNLIHFDKFDLNVKYDKKSLNLSANTTVNYYIDILSNRDYYYIFNYISSDELKEKSMCNSFKNKTEKLFKINIIGKSNYGILEIYDDSECKCLIDKYSTEKFLMK